MKVQFTPFALVLLWIGIIGGCASTSEDRSASAAPARRIHVATDATFPPFHFLNERDEPTGYDVELARELARRAGHTAEIVVVRPYERLWEGLARGEFDCVAATTGVTRQREEQWLLSDPYYTTAQVAVVRRGAGEPKSLEELRLKRVGAAGAGTSWLAAQSIHGAHAEQLGKGQAGVPSLLTGHIDALIVDEYEGVRAAAESEGMLDVLPTPVAMEHYAIVLRKSDVQLREDLNQALASMRRDGSLHALQERFGLLRPNEWPVRLNRR